MSQAKCKGIFVKWYISHDGGEGEVLLFCVQCEQPLDNIVWSCWAIREGDDIHQFVYSLHDGFIRV